MFQEFSREQILRIVTALFMVGTIFGINFMDYGLTEENIVEMIVTLVATVSAVSEIIGYFLRWSKGDVTLGGRRK